jgi:hypothetical protein
MATSTDTVSVSVFTLEKKQWLIRRSQSPPAGTCDGDVVILIVGYATLHHFDVTAGTPARYSWSLWNISIVSNVLSDKTSKGCDLPDSVVSSSGNSWGPQRGFEGARSV